MRYKRCRTGIGALPCRRGTLDHKENVMKIYLIHSNTLVQKVLTDFLLRLDHETVCFPHADELLRDGRDWSEPDVVIATLCASDTPDKRSLPAIHARYSHVPIIGISDPGFALPPKEAMRHGVYGYLHQPFSLEELELMLLRLAELV